jgi:hypothetical protein
MMTLLVILFGVTTLVGSAAAIWLALDRRRLHRRFAGILDLEREITARRHAFNIELARRQVVFDSTIAARRREVEGELAKRAADVVQAVQQTIRRVAN